MATLNAGSGADGNAIVSANKNISTESLVGRGYADMVPYQCTSVGANSCVTSAAPDGIVAGDEVLLINWQGISGNYFNVGNYETFTVDNVNASTITFTANKTKYYGNLDNGASNICPGAGGTATASSTTGGSAANAFNGNSYDPSYWRTNPGASEWIKYQFTETKLVGRYSIVMSNWPEPSPHAWTFEGSNDNTNWTVLDTKSGYTSGWVANTPRYFNCDTAVGEFLYYRLNMTGFNNAGDLIIGEIGMFENLTDTNIGTGGTNQRVRVQRIPQYNNLTIDNGYTLTANDAWDTGTGGILFLRAAGTLLVNGSIDMTGRGYTGGYNNYSGQWYYRTGAGINGGPRSAIKGSTSWFTTSNLGGGARGGWQGSFWSCAAGGGYGTAGEDGQDNAYAYQTQGGSTYGEATLSKLFLGSGGGSGDENGGTGTIRPDGGGAIALFATTVDIYGSILCDGLQSDRNTQFQDGAGSGGSILIHAGTIYTRSSTFTAIGALGKETNQPGSYSGGDGGDGRIAITYASLGDSLASVDPVPYTDDTLELPYAIEGTLSEACTLRVYDSSWGFIKSQAASAGSYQISNLPNPGPFFVIADPDGAERNILGYKGVIPTQ